MQTWQTVAIQIVPDAPLQLGTESTLSNYERTAAVISGAVLRGAVAEAALASCTQSRRERADHSTCPDRETCPFWQIFNPANEPLWGFAYPAPLGPAWPFPLTARTCKREPGYPHRDRWGRTTGHNVYDALIGQLVDNLLTDPNFPHRADILPQLKTDLATVKGLLRTTCPDCGEPLKPPVGYYAWDARQGPLYAGRASVRRATHVGINRARGVAEDSLLFTQESLDMAQDALFFHTHIRVPAAVWPHLQPYLDNREYTIGRGRSRGNGRVHILGDVIPTPEIADRVGRFSQAVDNALLRHKDDDARVQPTPGTFFTLTLRSPTILEHFGQPRARLEPEDLGLPDARLLRAWARTEVIGGWDSAARLPRATCLAIQAGSVFVYWTPAPNDDAALLARLAELEMTGVGAERPRGYGHVTVCAPFHTWNRLDLQERSKTL